MPALNKLRWRCRRGTRELDLLLIHYLDVGYASASSVEQQAFLSLLNVEDVELTTYLLGHTLPTDESLARVVAAIRLLPTNH